MNLNTSIKSELSERAIIGMAIGSANMKIEPECRFDVFSGYGESVDIFNLYQFGEAIDKFYEAPFEFVKDKQGNEKIVPTQIGKKLIELRYAETKYHHHYDCHDYIAVPLQELQKLKKYGLGLYDVDLAFEEKAIANAFNDWIIKTRDILKTEKVQQRILNRAKNAYRSYKSAVEYVDGLFEIYSRLNVVRLDIGYRRYSDGSMVSLEKTLADYSILRKAMKKHAMFKGCVGYIHRLELGMGNERYPEKKGYHFHLIFFFDHTLNRDEIKADQIGEYWEDVITDGLGIMHNCNRDKETEYEERNGIGKIHFSDYQKINNLKKYAIGYMTKASQYLAVKEKPRMRQFFKGQLPRNRSKAGRPRPS